jgi:pimeloyl-ACP methyl ester carboxylesterase
MRRIADAAWPGRAELMDSGAEVSMPTLFAAALAVGAVGLPFQTHFVQVAPVTRDPTLLVRSPGRDRAVVLIHGLHLHPFNRDNVIHANLRDWQKSDSLLVRQLGQDADVFAFAYAQVVAADDVADAPDLGLHVRRLQLLGYRSIVLVGYSAGGLIARAFVEDNPDAGVTKVVQVCTPNSGSSWARCRKIFSSQGVFLQSLTRETRREAQRDRIDKEVPPGVEFVCVVGTGSVVGDGLVSVDSQWPEDLQRQGVPARALATTHWHVLRAKPGVELIAALVREPQPRWDSRQVAGARKLILGH